jgi:hypothetical protein
MPFYLVKTQTFLMSGSSFTIKKALSAPAEGAVFTFEKVVPAA